MTGNTAGDPTHGVGCPLLASPDCLAWPACLPAHIAPHESLCDFLVVSRALPFSALFWPAATAVVAVGNVVHTVCSLLSNPMNRCLFPEDCPLVPPT